MQRKRRRKVLALGWSPASTALGRHCAALTPGHLVAIAGHADQRRVSQRQVEAPAYRDSRAGSKACRTKQHPTLALFHRSSASPKFCRSSRSRSRSSKRWSAVWLRCRPRTLPPLPPLECPPAPKRCPKHPHTRPLLPTTLPYQPVRPAVPTGLSVGSRQQPSEVPPPAQTSSKSVPKTSTHTHTPQAQRSQRQLPADTNTAQPSQ